MSDPRFLADAMLGRLARWLRALGYDTLHQADATPDAALVARAEEDARILLTRDRQLLRDLRPSRGIAVASDVPLLQPRQVVDACALPSPRALFTRCMLCNTVLDTLEGDAAIAAVPPGARGLDGAVRRCRSCGRVYWHGSHARRMKASLAREIPAWRAGYGADD